MIVKLAWNNYPTLNLLSGENHIFRSVCSLYLRIRINGLLVSDVISGPSHGSANNLQTILLPF